MQILVLTRINSKLSPWERGWGIYDRFSLSEIKEIAHKYKVKLLKCHFVLIMEFIIMSQFSTAI